jgi:hypothetical protein
MQFRDLAEQQTFDFINDAEPRLTSFWERCVKTGPRTYASVDTGVRYRVGSIDAQVFHPGDKPTEINPMNAIELAKMDNEADRTIKLEISGNRLVSILNALDQSLFVLGKYRLQGDGIVAETQWHTDLYATTEAIRDELSRQRMT